MAQLAAWVVFCLGLALLARNRPLVPVLTAICLWVVLPGVASSVVTGQPRGSSLAYHPSTWLLLLALAVQVVLRFRAFTTEIASRIFVYLALGLFLTIALLTTVTGPGGGLVLYFSQMVGPIALFVLLSVALRERPARVAIVRNWLIGLAALQSVIALVERGTSAVLLYRTQYQSNYWFQETANTRWMGTLDHPLTLSLMLCATVPLLAGIRRAALQLPLLLLMCAGVLASQSRTGLGVVGVGAVFVIVTSRVRLPVKALSLSVLAGAAVWAATSSLSSGVADRLSYDSGSADARGDALTFFFTNAPDFLLKGGGIGSARDVAKYGGLITSLESSFLIYAVDLGILAAALYFGTQAVIAVRTIGRSVVPGLWFSALVVVVQPQTYNALNSQTFAGPLIWTVLALAAAGLTVPRRAVDGSVIGKESMTPVDALPTEIGNLPSPRPMPAMPGRWSTRTAPIET